MTVYVTGDTHGMFSNLVHWCQDHNLTNEDTVIILGDNGLNFHLGWKDYNTKKSLTKNTLCNFFVIRGNHDVRPENALIPRGATFPHAINSIYNGQYVPWANTEEFFGNKVMVEEKFPQIKYAEDGLIYTINGKKCLIIGGGYSVDKFYRLMNGWKWVENEQLSEREMEEIFETFQNNEVNVILSHVGPRTFERFIRHLWMNPEGGITGGWDNIDHTMEDWMNKFLGYNCQEIELWYFGHSHANLNAGPMGVMLYEAVVPFGEKAPVIWTEDNRRGVDG